MDGQFTEKIIQIVQAGNYEALTALTNTGRVLRYSEFKEQWEELTPWTPTKP